jgi:Flp pilus assembly protein CpaB
METNSMLVIFAIVAALGLVTLVAMDIILTSQEADAAKPPTQGCRNSIAVNASQGRCFHG